MRPSGQRIVRRLLAPRGRKILREYIVTTCAGDPEVLTRVRLQHVVLKTEQFVSALPFIYFLLFKLTLFMLEYSIPPLALKLRPFTWLPLEKRLKYLEQFQGSSIYFKRTLFKMVHAVCVSHLYSERKLLMYVGFSRSMEHRERRPVVN